MPFSFDERMLESRVAHAICDSVWSNINALNTHVSKKKKKNNRRTQQTTTNRKQNANFVLIARIQMLMCEWLLFCAICIQFRRFSLFLFGFEWNFAFFSHAHVVVCPLFFLSPTWLFCPFLTLSVLSSLFSRSERKKKRKLKTVHAFLAITIFPLLRARSLSLVICFFVRGFIFMNFSFLVFHALPLERRISPGTPTRREWWHEKPAARAVVRDLDLFKIFHYRRPLAVCGCFFFNLNLYSRVISAVIRHATSFLLFEIIQQCHQWSADHDLTNPWTNARQPINFTTWASPRMLQELARN